MGRDIDFAGSELSFHGHNPLYKSKEGMVISHNVKTHRTGLHASDDPYEDYGVLLWMDKDGNLKEKGNKKVRLESQSYQPTDFVKTWDVPIEIGDYGVEAVSWFGGKHIGRTVRVFRVKGFGSYLGYDYKFRVITECVGSIVQEDSLESISIKEIQGEFDEKFWKGVEKALKIPKEFKKVKGYDEYYYDVY